MPIAILISDAGNIPAILQERGAALLLRRLQTLAEFPDDVNTAAAARVWLRSKAPPSGWYDSEDEAMAAIHQLRQRLTYTGAPVRRARENLGQAMGLDKPLSRVHFAELLGYEGKARNNGDIIGQIERGKRVMGREKSARLNAVLVEYGLAGAGK